MGNNTKTKKSKRIFYFDALRSLAIISVILFHCAKRLKYITIASYTPTLNYVWLFGDFFLVTTLIGVDLFLMLSGALSLGREWDIRTFLGKRIPRIVSPFVFWGIVLSIIIIFIQYQIPGIYNAIGSFTPESIISFIIGAWNAKSFGFGPYWFFWMILGTYLIMPVLNKWLLHADLKEAEYFLVIWLISCLFDFTLEYPFPIKISYFSGPIGMVVLGYYLRHTQRKIFKSKILPIIMIIVGIVCMVGFSFYLSSDSNVFFFSRYSIFNAIEVTGIFLLFRNYSGVNLHSKFLSNPNGIIRKSIFSIAKYSYGFYLIHQAIMDILIAFLQYYNMYIGFRSLYFVLFILTLGISWIVMAGLNRIPYVNQVIGAK